DRAVEAPVASEVDLTHSPRTDPLQELVRPYQTADVTGRMAFTLGHPREPSWSGREPFPGVESTPRPKTRNLRCGGAEAAKRARPRPKSEPRIRLSSRIV